MADKDIQQQINELNQKVDLILEYVNQQRLKADVVEDLVSDLSIIGKDVYDSTVAELENRSIEIDPDELRDLGVGLVRNIKTFNSALKLFESMNDLVKDAAPIANELIIDFTQKLHEFDQKGYFEFFTEAGNIIDNIVSHYSKEDVKSLADNIVVIMETVKGMTQPEMLKSIDNAVKVYGSMEVDNIPEYSMFGALREMRKPEMKKALGFMITFLKNISNTNK